MTFLARPAEISLVSVVACMAAVARPRQRDSRNMLLAVARGAYEPGMRACQRKARLLIVIEAPARPSIWRVTKGAIAAKRALVMLIAMAA